VWLHDWKEAERLGDAHQELRDRIAKAVKFKV
jgi:hypothetical protein